MGQLGSAHFNENCALSAAERADTAWPGIETRDRLPNAAVILAAVHDPKYPKLRPIGFLAESCALARTYRKNGEPYSPRYSRDICYQEKKRRGPATKPLTTLEFWLEQAKLEQRVPRRYRRRIDKLLAEEQARSEAQKIRTELTYVNIHEKMEGMKKKRTTVWLPETTVAKLKKLSVATGAPMAELFRRAVEAYLNRS